MPCRCRLRCRPKLIETTETPGRLRAVLTAVEVKSDVAGGCWPRPGRCWPRGRWRGPTPRPAIPPPTNPSSPTPPDSCVPPFWSSLVKLGGVGQAELDVELVQVAGGEVGAAAADQVRIVVGVDDGDGLARPGADDRAQLDTIDPVSPADLRRGQPDRRGGVRCDGGQGACRAARWRETTGEIARVGSGGRAGGRLRGRTVHDVMILKDRGTEQSPLLQGLDVQPAKPRREDPLSPKLGRTAAGGPPAATMPSRSPPASKRVPGIRGFARRSHRPLRFGPRRSGLILSLDAESSIVPPQKRQAFPPHTGRSVCDFSPAGWRPLLLKP